MERKVQFELLDAATKSVRQKSSVPVLGFLADNFLDQSRLSPNELGPVCALFIALADMEEKTRLEPNKDPNFENIGLLLARALTSEQSNK